MGLAVKKSIVRESTSTQELMNELLMPMTFNLVDTSNAITFFVAYGPTDTMSNTREQKDAVWQDFNSPASRASSSENLFFYRY